MEQMATDDYWVTSHIKVVRRKHRIRVTTNLTVKRLKELLANIPDDSTFDDFESVENSNQSILTFHEKSVFEP